MPRALYDDFTKDLIESLLSPHGQVVSPRRISGEARQIDIAFWPAPNLTTLPPDLGLLGQMATTPALFEPFRNPVSAEDIGDCLGKSLELRAQLRRDATRGKKPWTRDQWPFLWVMTPTASPEVLAEFAATMTDRWGPGIYLMPSYLHAAIVVIHQLPKTPETMRCTERSRSVVKIVRARKGKGSSVSGVRSDAFG